MNQTVRRLTSDIGLKPENGKKLLRVKGYDVSSVETAWWLADQRVYLAYQKNFKRLKREVDFLYEGGLMSPPAAGRQRLKPSA